MRVMGLEVFNFKVLIILTLPFVESKMIVIYLLINKQMKGNCTHANFSSFFFPFPFLFNFYNLFFFIFLANLVLYHNVHLSPTFSSWRIFSHNFGHFRIWFITFFAFPSLLNLSFIIFLMFFSTRCPKYSPNNNEYRQMCFKLGKIKSTPCIDKKKYTPCTKFLEEV